jgi:hypothetical protein
MAERPLLTTANNSPAEEKTYARHGFNVMFSKPAFNQSRMIFAHE